MFLKAGIFINATYREAIKLSFWSYYDRPCLLTKGFAKRQIFILSVNWTFVYVYVNMTPSGNAHQKDGISCLITDTVAYIHLPSHNLTHTHSLSPTHLWLSECKTTIRSAPRLITEDCFPSVAKRTEENTFHLNLPAKYGLDSWTIGTDWCNIIKQTGVSWLTGTQRHHFALSRST